MTFFTYSYIVGCYLRGIYKQGLCDAALSELTPHVHTFQEDKPFTVVIAMHSDEEEVDSWEEIEEIQTKLPALLEEVKTYLIEHQAAIKTCIASGVLYPYVDFPNNETQAIFIPPDFVQALADLSMGLRMTQVGDTLKEQLSNAGLSDDE